MPKLLLLELFSGTGSIGRAFEAQGWEVISVDCDPRANPTLRADIAQFEAARELHGRHVSAIWASPPCTNYSVARRSAETAAGDLESSDQLVRKTLEIAKELGSPMLFLENPWTGKLRHRGLLDHLKLHKVSYCKYQFPYRKNTAIWTSTEWKPARPPCRHDCPATQGGKHTARAQQGPPGPRFSQRELYRIPPELCEEIARFCTEAVVVRDARPGQ